MEKTIIRGLNYITTEREGIFVLINVMGEEAKLKGGDGNYYNVPLKTITYYPPKKFTHATQEIQERPKGEILQFGKYKGYSIQSVPKSYLDYMVKTMDKKNTLLKMFWNEIKRRNARNKEKGAYGL